MSREGWESVSKSWWHWGPGQLEDRLPRPDGSNDAFSPWFPLAEEICALSPTLGCDALLLAPLPWQ